MNEILLEICNKKILRIILLIELKYLRVMAISYLLKKVTNAVLLEMS